MVEITVVADDLTGALDTGVKFGGDGRVVMVHWRGAPPECDVLVIDTDSRALPPESAAARIGEWAGCLGGTVYKKVDSTLRGPFAAEAWALALALGRRGVLLAPASPAVGRTVRAGRLYVGGRPLEDTPFGRDPLWPACTSEVAGIVAGQVPVPVVALGLAEVRAGSGAIRRALAQAYGIAIADAECDADLMAIARALPGLPEWLPAGSAGLAQALATARGWRPLPMALPAELRPRLLLCGSHNAASHAQVSALAAARGLPVVAGGAADDVAEALRVRWRQDGLALAALPPAPLPREQAQAALASLVDAAVGLILREALPSVFVTGGETLRLLADGLHINGLQTIGEVEPGVVLSRAAVEGGRALSIISRAGGFGGDDLLVRLVSERC